MKININKINRSEFIKTLLLSLGGVIGVSSCSSKRKTSFVKHTVNYNSYPIDWVRLQGKKFERYVKFIDSLDLKHIQTHDVIKVHARRKGSVWNSLPPESLWGNITPTLKAVDHVCIKEGVRVKEIVSLYRSPAYNSRCGGAKPNSWHKKNVAMDVIMSNASPRKMFNLFKGYRKGGLFRGGVGSYSGFTHIDTRGYDATW